MNAGTFSLQADIFGVIRQADKLKVGGRGWNGDFGTAVSRRRGGREREKRRGEIGCGMEGAFPPKFYP